MIPSLLVLLAFAGVGTYSLYKGGRRFRQVYHIRRNDPRPVRELSSHRGPVELAGRALEGEAGTIEAPFTGTPCLAYTYEVEEYRSGSRGRTWETMAEGEEGTDFVLEDETGRVAVDPTGAELNFEAHTVTVDAHEEPPERITDFIAMDPSLAQFHQPGTGPNSSAAIGNEQRFTERRLDPGEDVYVYGEATLGHTVEWGTDLVDALVADGEASPVFVVSDTDDRGTAWRLARTGLWKLGAGLFTLAVVAVAGAVVLL